MKIIVEGVRGFMLVYFLIRSGLYKPIRSCSTHWIEEIKRNTIVSVDHLTPDIALHLITKDCEIYHHRHQEHAKIFPNDPFWAFYWPGGQAITKYILDHPRVVEGKNILDIGSGCGASSIAAIKMGAARAVANDIDKGERNSSSCAKKN